MRRREGERITRRQVMDMIDVTRMFTDTGSACEESPRGIADRRS